jgi:hypothetical protein
MCRAAGLGCGCGLSAARRCTVVSSRMCLCRFQLTSWTMMHKCTVEPTEKHARRRAGTKRKCNCTTSGHHVQKKKMQFLFFFFFLDAPTYLTYRVNRAFLYKLLFQTSGRISPGPGKAIRRDKERNRHRELKRNLLQYHACCRRSKMDSADRLIYSAQVISHVDHAQMIQPTKCLMNTCAVQLQLARGIIEERGGRSERKKERSHGWKGRKGRS